VLIEREQIDREFRISEEWEKFKVKVKEIHETKQVKNDK